MGKLKLSVDQLAVETFATRELGAFARGTVHARQATSYETCALYYTCGYDATCEQAQTCYMDCSMDCTLGPRC